MLATRVRNIMFSIFEENALPQINITRNFRMEREVGGGWYKKLFNNDDNNPILAIITGNKEPPSTCGVYVCNLYYNA